MKYIPEMQKNKTKKRSPKKTKKTSPHAIFVTCRCHHRDNMDIGLIWCWVSILQRNKEVHWSWTVQRRHMKGQRGRTERTGPGWVMLSSLPWRVKTSKTKKRKQEVYLNHSLLIQICIYLFIFSWYGPLISWKWGQIARDILWQEGAAVAVQRGE